MSGFALSPTDARHVGHHAVVLARINVALLWVAALGFAATFVKVGVPGQDAHAYWAALQGGPLYDGRPTELDAYLYSPAFAQALTPLGWLPWWGFYGVWLGLGVVAVWWLVKPLPVRWAVPVALFCVPDLIIGNVYVFLAVMVALGVRAPGAWTFGVLTKVTPGVGVLWHAARRDWSAVSVAASVTAGVVAVSAAIDPAAWRSWLAMLTGSESGDPTFIPRCVAAVAVVVVAARSERLWLLPVAVVLATPVFTAVACLVPLAAIPRLTGSPSRRPDCPTGSPSMAATSGERRPSGRHRVGTPVVVRGR